MRWVPRAIPILIGIISLDFAMVFGFEAWRILMSPVAGLERAAFADLVRGIGALAGLGAGGLIDLAIFFGTVNLAIAVIFALHLASRVGSFRGGRVSHDLLDAGLILVVASTIVAATPAILHGATEIMIQERLPLWLVGLAATLSMIERFPETETRRSGRMPARTSATAEKAAMPAARGSAQAPRWNRLRREAGIAAEPALPAAPWFRLR